MKHLLAIIILCIVIVTTNGCTPFSYFYMVNKLNQSVPLTIQIGKNSEHLEEYHHLMLHYADSILVIDNITKEQLNKKLLYNIIRSTDSSTTVTCVLPPHSTTNIGEGAKILPQQFAWIAITKPSGTDTLTYTNLWQQSQSSRFRYVYTVE
ncbi:MAG: hypothetical protein U0Y96_00995 [Candidatus Kapaibacterium sp.]